MLTVKVYVSFLLASPTIYFPFYQTQLSETFCFDRVDSSKINSIEAEIAAMQSSWYESCNNAT